MKKFNNTNKFDKPKRGNKFEDRNSSRPRFAPKDSGYNQMHDAICADCKGSCKVPFIPSSGKPVYCSNCFEKRGNGNNKFAKPNNNYQENYNKQFEIINTKLDKILKILATK